LSAVLDKNDCLVLGTLAIVAFFETVVDRLVIRYVEARELWQLECRTNFQPLGLSRLMQRHSESTKFEAVKYQLMSFTRR
jgi:hypothetical protein